MSRNNRLLAGLCLFVWVVTAIGCTDRLATITDPQRFPDGVGPTTIQHLVSTAELGLTVTQIPGTTTARQTPHLITARNFDGELNANAVASFGPFPDSVLIDFVYDSVFTYSGGIVSTVIADTLAVSEEVLAFELWELTQAFDADATWTQADAAGTPWTTPGGPRGQLLGYAFWASADTAVARDTLQWNIPAAVMAAMAERGSARFLVTLVDEFTRAPITPLRLEALVVPSSEPDTVLHVPISSEVQAYVFDPQPAQPPGVLRIGGVTSDRALFHMTLPALIPGCPEGVSPGCPGVAPGSVNLNRVELVFDPVPVANGFRPIAPMTIVFRRLLEPDLGDLAPLGPIATAEPVAGDRFVAPGADPVGFSITAAVADAFARGHTELALAMQVEPPGSTFSYAWFENHARLRFVYTLPQTPRLP